MDVEDGDLISIDKSIEENPSSAKSELFANECMSYVVAGLLEELRKGSFEKNDAVTELVGILKKMPKNISSETLSKLLPNILDFLNNSHIENFATNLLCDKETSSIFGAVLLDHYCNIENLRSLANKTSEEAQIYLSLLENVFKDFEKFPGKYEALKKAFPDEFVKNSIKLVLTARYPIRYLSLLKELFSVKFPDPFIDSTCLPFITVAFNHWIDTPLEDKTWNMLLELILLVGSLIPKSLSEQFINYLPLLIKTVNFLLNRSDNVVDKALILLMDLINTMDIKFLEYIPVSLKDNLLLGLYFVMKSAKQEICYKAAIILGKFRSSNRENFEDLQRLTFQESGGPNLFISFRDKEVSIPFMSIIDSVLVTVLDPNVSSERKKNCESIAESFLDFYIIRKSEVESLTGDGFVEYGNSNFRSVVKTALIIKFVDFSNTDEKKNKFLMKLIESISKLNVIFDKLFMKHLDFYPILIEATVDVRCCMAKDGSREICLNCFRAVISLKNDCSSTFLKQITDKIILLCHESSLISKLLGYKAIDLVLKEASVEYKYDCIPMFLKPLLYLISDLSGNVTFGSIKDVSNLLHNNLLHCFAATNDTLIQEKQKESFDKTTIILAEEIVSKNYLIRKEARKCVYSLSTIRNMSISELMRTAILPIISKLVKPVLNVKPVILLYLFEDFEFSKEFTNDKDKDCFPELKISHFTSYVEYKDEIKQNCLTPIGHNLKIQECCGALYALCFNFKDNIEDRIDIFNQATESTIYDILNAALQCLKYVFQKNPKREMVDKFLKFHAPFKSMKPLTNSQFLKLEFLLESFPSVTLEIVLQHLQSIKKEILDDSGDDMDNLIVKLKVAANWIGILTIKTIDGVEKSVTEVIPSVIDIIKNLSSRNMFSKKIAFREQLLKFCIAFPKEAVSYFSQDISNKMYNESLEIRKVIEDILKDGTIQNYFQQSDINTLIFYLNLNSFNKIDDFIGEINEQFPCKNEILKLLYKEQMNLQIQNFCLIKNVKIDFKKFFSFFELSFIEIRKKDFLLSIANVIISQKNKALSLKLKAELCSYYYSCLQEEKHYDEVFQFLIKPLFSSEKLENEVFQFLIKPLFSSEKLENKTLLKTFCSKTETVLNMYHEHISKLSFYTLNIEILFLKRRSAIKQEIMEMISNETYYLTGLLYSSIFQSTGKVFHLKDLPLEAKQCVYFICLLVFSVYSEEIFPVLLQYLREIYKSTPDSKAPVFQVLVLDLLIAENHKNLLYEWIKNYTKNKVLFNSEDVLILIKFILEHHEVLYPVHHAFTNLMVNFAVELIKKFTSTLDIEMAIDLIKIIIEWDSFYEIEDLKNKIKENAELVINFLFKTVCSISCYGMEFKVKDQKLFLDKCLNLLKDKKFEKLLKSFDFKLEIWDEKKVISIIDDSQKCEAFERMVDAFDHMSDETWMASDSGKFLENIASLFKSERILQSLFKLLFKFSQRKDVPPKDLSKMYTDIHDINKKYLFCVKVMFEANGCYDDSVTLTVEEMMTFMGKCDLDIVMKCALNILKIKKDKKCLPTIYVDIQFLYKKLSPLIKTVSLETMLTVLEIIYVCMFQFTICSTINVRNGKKICLFKSSSINELKQAICLLNIVYNQMLDFSVDKEYEGKMFYIHEQIVKYKEMNADESFKKLIFTDEFYSNHFEICNMIFKYLAKTEKHNLFEILIQFYGNMKINHYLCKIQCHKLLSELDVKFISFSKSSRREENLLLFYSIMDLCRTDSFLTAHMWNNMFQGFWKILDAIEQKNLCDDIERLFLKKIATEKDLEVFVNAAIKCAPHLYNIYLKNVHLNKEHSFESFTTQVHYALENSADKKSDNIKILEEIYCNLKEYDSIYSLYPSQCIINLCTFETALSYELNGNDAFRACDFYIKATKEKEVIRNPDIHQLVKAGQHKCLMELETWKDSSVVLNKQTQFEKELISLGNNENSKISCETEKRIYLKRIKSCNGFPGRILSNNDYSVLQSLHKLTEHLEVWNLKRSENAEIHKKHLNRYHSLWKSGKYLLSDDQIVLAELFDVRRSAYENFIENYPKEIDLINEATKLRDEASIKFSSTAINIGKFPVPLSNNSVLNSYDSIKDNFSWLLLQVKKSDHSLIRAHLLTGTHLQEHQTQNVYYLEMIKRTLDILDEKCHLNKEFNEKEILSLNGYIEEIQNELIYKRALEDKTAEWKQLIEYLEKSCLKRNDENYTMQYLKCLLETCKSGNTSLYLKFITKILWSLQNVHKMPSIIKFLKEKHHSCIPLHYWLPFLSLLILYTVQTKEVTTKIEHQVQESTSLLFDQVQESTSLLFNILIQLAQKYPQETFFAIWNFKSSFVFETQDLKEKLFSIMELLHPRLISSLKEMMADLQSLKSNIFEHHHWLMSIMEKTYHSLFLTLKSEKLDSEAEIVKNCKNSIISCYQNSFAFLDLKDSHLNESYFINELKKKNTLAELLSLLTSTVQKYFQKLKNKSVLLPDICKFLLSYHTLCQNIKMLPKCHTLENSISPPVEIAKFEPIINVCQWINCFAYKINVRGNDGKVYSYLLMENNRPEETQKSDQIMQFLGIVNAFFAESGNLSQNFLKFYLPSIFSVGPKSKLVPFFDSPIPYLDVFKKETVFVPIFDNYLIQEYFKVKNSETNIQDSLTVIQELFSKSSVPEDAFTLWVNNVYSPIEQFYFKKQFLRDFSMQYTAELLNLSSRKETMIHRETGRISPLYLEFKNKNLIENIPAAESVSILSQNLKEFFGPQGLKRIANNVYRVSSVLREDQIYLIPQFLMFSTNYGSEIYTQEEVKICERQMTEFIAKRIGMNLSEINVYLNRCTSSAKLCDLFSLYP